MKNLSKISVGVDVSKDHLDICFYQIKKPFRIKNNHSGFKKLLQELTCYKVKQIVCESSGGYEDNFLRTMDKAGYSTWQVEPKRIKAFAISEGIKAKTDAIDAKIIAMFADQKKGKFKPKCTNDKKFIRLRAFINRKVDLIKQISNEKKKLKHPALTACDNQMKDHIVFMEQQIAVLDKEIDKMINDNDDWNKKSKIMQSIPGVGKATSSTLIAHMPELGSLANKKAAALLGVAPYTKQSGKYIGVATIKGGRSIPRNIVYMAALTSSRHNPVLKKFYDRLISSGKKPKVALVAVMNKLIHIINSMLRDGKTWIVQ